MYLNMHTFSIQRGKSSRSFIQMTSQIQSEDTGDKIIPTQGSDPASHSLPQQMEPAQSCDIIMGGDFNPSSLLKDYLRCQKGIVLIFLPVCLHSLTVEKPWVAIISSRIQIERSRFLTFNFLFYQLSISIRVSFFFFSTKNIYWDFTPLTYTP